VQANNGTALSAHKVIGGYANCPTVTSCLANDLVRGVNVFWSANAGYLGHFFGTAE
jgi:hypothetical protein